MYGEGPGPKCSTHCISQTEQTCVISTQVEKQNITCTPRNPVMPLPPTKDNQHPDSNGVDLTLFFWLCLTACGILVPQPGIDPVPPAVEAWSPNH